MPLTPAFPAPPPPDELVLGHSVAAASAGTFWGIDYQCSSSATQSPRVQQTCAPSYRRALRGLADDRFADLLPASFLRRAMQRSKAGHRPHRRAQALVHLSMRRWQPHAQPARIGAALAPGYFLFSEPQREDRSPPPCTFHSNLMAASCSCRGAHCFL